MQTPSLGAIALTHNEVAPCNPRFYKALMCVHHILNCAYRLHAAERKIDVKVRNIGQQKCYNDLRKRRRSLTWRTQRRSRFRSFAPDSARKTPAGQNYFGFGFRTALSARNAAVRNITLFADGTRSSAAPAGIRPPSRPSLPLTVWF